MTRKQISWVIALLAFVLAVAVFFIVSVCLAQQHGVQLIQEWKNWFGINENVKQVAETTVNIVKSLKV